MTSEQEKEYLLRIRDLEKQVSRLQTELKKNSETDYGLRWMDVPEAFEKASENAIPTLEEVKEKAISTEDGKPTHILIEGDNYHALACLNYTHKGKIDVIYIDPPYNTGENDFVYKDKRILDKFPDGSPVPKDHPLRHSYWLSFMTKRLKLAQNLLSKRGVIFISIDDNEQANLRLLCDSIFGEKNFVAQLVWEKKKKGSFLSNSITNIKEYVLVYCVDKNAFGGLIGEINSDTETYPCVNASNKREKRVIPAGIESKYKKKNFSLPAGSEISDTTMSLVLHSDLVIKNGILAKELIIEGNWRYSQEAMREYAENREIYITRDLYLRRIVKEERCKTLKDILPRVGEDNELQYNSYINYDNLLESGWGSNEDADEELRQIFGIQKLMNYPKPIRLIVKLLASCRLKDAKILDFFAGSGTTMHATMQLNQEDGGHRQCILVQLNENNICEGVTYERSRRVIQGYTNANGEQVAGIGNSMKYYHTAFVGEHVPSEASDQDKTILAQKAGCLLALSENTLEEIRATQAYQIFALRDGDKPTNNCLYTAVYFSGNYANFGELRQEIEKLQTEHNHPKIAIYVFCWGDPSVFENEFDDLQGLVIKDIPQPILDIYNKINA